MTKSSILIDLEDPRTEKIADVISNKTSKKILSTLAEKELTETEISSQLKIPMNTVNYNIKKLESTGFIEKTKDYFWSVKGKKVHKYKISNKNIIISPKSIVKGIIPAFIITAIVAFFIKIFVGVETASKISEEKAITETAGAADTAVATIAEGAVESTRIVLPPAQETLTNVITNGANSWAWFLLGALITILIIILWNSSKKLKGGN